MIFTEFITRLIGGIIGTMGFVIFFEVKKNRMLASLIGGVIGTAAYLVLEYLGVHEFFANAGAAFIITIYSECAARLLRTPVIVFQIPGVIVLVPGKALYHTMSNLITGHFDEAGQYAVVTISIAAGIIIGIVCGTMLYSIVKLTIRSFSAAVSERTKK